MSGGLGLDDLSALFGTSTSQEAKHSRKSAEPVVDRELVGLLEGVRSERAHEPHRPGNRIEASAWLAVPDDQWGWTELRDYIVSESERRFGPTPRNPAKEAGIAKGFMSRWGPMAVPIARRAFDCYEGMWSGAPVRMERFSKGSDAYFAERIAAEVGRSV